ncbi:MAG: transketolase, partial [Verrucomicrobia bacterium]|nr:transketolase [Verrucomicrobiota bacterium]
EIDGHNMEEFQAVFQKAKAANSGRPQFIVAHTLVGKGIPEVAGTNKAHGEAGVKFVDADRKTLGLPDEKFYVSKEVRAYFADHRVQLKKAYDAWQDTFASWKKANPELAKILDDGLEHRIPADLLDQIPVFDREAKIATRKAGSEVLQPLANALPLLIGGSADLYGSTLNYIKSDKDFNADNRSGRNIRFGIREHGMCAILNGIAYYGLFRPSGATFLVFADYCRASIRLAALAKLPVVYIFTHDSIGLGEDGPTHEPIETVSALRLLPNLDVIRPADPEETAGAFVAALERTGGPTLLALSRQTLPNFSDVPVEVRRNGALKGAYVLHHETGPLEIIIIATGSEVQHAVAAAKQLGDGIRVVSAPSLDRFERQDASYREEVLPSACRKRVSIEAGVTEFWYKYVGLDGKRIGVDRFGLSAPGGAVMKELGITADHVVETVKSLVG